MAMRVTSLYSGLDTETIITQLVKAKQTKVDALKKKQTTLQWKQDAWKTLNTKIQNLFSKTLENMRWQDSYTKKTTTVSNSSAVSVVTGNSAVNGTQLMTVSQMAKPGYLTGAQLSTNGKFTALSKISDLDPSFSESGTIDITANGKTTSVKITADTTISNVVSQLKNAGLNASFDAKNQRLFVSAKASGADNDFSISASDAAGQRALEALGLNTSLSDDKATLAYYEEYNSYYVEGDYNATILNMSGMIDSDVNSKVSSYLARYNTLTSSITNIQDKLTQAETDYTVNYNGSTETIDSLTDTIANLKDQLETAADDDVKADLVNQITAAQGQLSGLEKMESYKTQITGYEAQQAEILTHIDVADDGNGGITATADQSLIDEVSQKYYDRAEYAAQVMAAYDPDAASSGGATRIAGQNAVIDLNGARFESDTNVFEINGLTISVLQESSETISLTTQDDTDGIYDMIKNFIKEYNALIIEMDTLYNAASAKDYSPLTDDEKAEMSDKDIEEWEKKIKDSILRRDSTLGDFKDVIKTVMASGVTVNGKTMYLSDFGINTLSYFSSGDNEKGAYHIDGDSDDSNTSSNEDLLRSMIASNPEAITKFFSELGKSLYSKIDSYMKSSRYSTFNYVYEDKLMKEQYDNYTTKISEAEKKLKAYEDKWYSKFSAMEVALSKLESNSNAVTQLLGG